MTCLSLLHTYVSYRQCLKVNTLDFIMGRKIQTSLWWSSLLVSEYIPFPESFTHALYIDTLASKTKRYLKPGHTTVPQLWPVKMTMIAKSFSKTSAPPAHVAECLSCSRDRRSAPSPHLSCISVTNVAHLCHPGSQSHWGTDSSVSPQDFVKLGWVDLVPFMGVQGYGSAERTFCTFLS